MNRIVIALPWRFPQLRHAVTRRHPPMHRSLSRRSVHGARRCAGSAIALAAICFNGSWETRPRERLCFGNRPVRGARSATFFARAPSPWRLGALVVLPCRTERQRMAVQPERAGNRCRINPELFSPGRFIAVAMHFEMMAAAEWNGELVTDLTTERAALVKRRWWASQGIRPQTRHGCWATRWTCSRSQTRRGSSSARALLSTPAPRRPLMEALG